MTPMPFEKELMDKAWNGPNTIRESDLSGFRLGIRALWEILAGKVTEVSWRDTGEWEIPIDNTDGELITELTDYCDSRNIGHKDPRHVCVVEKEWAEKQISRLAIQLAARDITISEAQGYIEMQDKQLAERDRQLEFWKSSHKTTLDAANGEIAKLKVEMALMLNNFNGQVNINRKAHEENKRLREALQNAALDIEIAARTIWSHEQDGKHSCAISQYTYNQTMLRAKIARQALTEPQKDNI